MRKFSKYFIIAILGILPWQVCRADVTTTVPVVTTSYSTVEATIVDNYDLGGDASTTKVYDESEHTGGNAGAISIGHLYKPEVSYHVDLKTLGSTTITLTFEGKIDNDMNDTTGQWMLLYTKAFTAVNTQYSLTLSEKALKHVRVGMVSDDGGTDDITIKMRAVGDPK